MLGACAAPAPATGASSVVVRAPVAQAGSANLPTLRALQGAVEEGADELARRLVENLRRRPLTADEERLVEAFERILTGRELLEGVDLSLEVVPPAEDGAAAELQLVATSAAGAMSLRLPPADLEHLRVAVAPDGTEERALASRLVDVFGPLELPAEGERRLSLGPVSEELGRALALRDTWRLVLRSGEVQSGGEVYPAARLSQPRCERVLRAEEVPAGDVRAVELLAGFAAALEEGRAAEDVRAVDSGALLELAVRLAPGDRDSVLRGLLPILRSAPEGEADLGPALAPALAWVTRTRAPGADLDLWSGWLASWVAREDQRRAREEQAGALDLPSGAVRREGTGGGGLDLK